MSYILILTALNGTGYVRDRLDLVRTKIETSSLADILIPKFRAIADKIAHELFALFGINVN